MTSSIDPMTMISAIKAQTESTPIIIGDEENLRPKKKKKKKTKKTDKSEKEKKMVRGEVEPLKGVYYEHQVKGHFVLILLKFSLLVSEKLFQTLINQFLLVCFFRFEVFHDFLKHHFSTVY